MNNIVRRLLERLARGRIIKRNIFSKNGKLPIYISPDAQLKYLKWGRNAFDADLIKIADHLVQSNHVVWDIGANVGIFSFTCAYKNAATVVAIEADTWLCSVLRKTTRLDAYVERDIRILPFAVSDQNGVA